jgi:hypothetical protein
VSGEVTPCTVGYWTGTLEPYPLKFVESEGVPLSYGVADNVRLSADKTELRVNPSLTVAGIPPEVFDYRLGNRSALEWLIDQYGVTEDARSGIRSDPNRADDPEYIVRLVGQVVRVTLGDGTDRERLAGTVRASGGCLTFAHKTELAV